MVWYNSPMSNDSQSPDKSTLHSNYAQADKDELLTLLEQKDKRIQVLEEYVRLARSKRFTPSSEKCDAQMLLFNEAELTLDVDDSDDLESDSESPVIPASENQPPKKKPGRKPFADDLPREPIYLALSEAEKAGATRTFYSKVKEELDIIPAKVRILEYYQEKAVFEDQSGQPQMVAAPLPQHPVPQALGSLSLMAHIIVSKYVDGLPLYRQESIFKRYGGDITRATMARWMIRLSEPLQAMVNLLREHQASYDIIQMDETRIQVLKEPGYSPDSKKHMWVTRGGPPDQPSVLFEYEPSRSQQVPLRLLEDYGGFLQSDGYSVYDAVSRKKDITLLGCWDHVRRKFKEAQDAQPPKGKNKKVTKADMAIAHIAKLYQVERLMKDADMKTKLQTRQSKSLPLLKQFKKWLDKNVDKVDKQGLTGKAFTYAINQWDKLTVYCQDGRLNISNALAENAIRPFVIGRKAWLFADTPKGAKASSILYSLVETAKVNQLEPYAYLTKIFTKIPYAQSVEDFEALLPWNIELS